MASECEASCDSDPNFAVICAFLERFGPLCGLSNIDFLDLQEMIENTQEVSPELINLHVKLLRKARKTVHAERWERAVIKFCHTFCSQDAWELERFGYKKARLTSKVRILKELLESQFDYNQKLKTEINKLSAAELRSQPIGRDSSGRVYWYQCDESCQIRIYKDDPDEETWSLVARDRDTMASLISRLNNGDSTKSSSEPVSNEDSNSLEPDKPTSNPETPTLDTGQPTAPQKTPEKIPEVTEEDNACDALDLSNTVATKGAPPAPIRLKPLAELIERKTGKPLSFNREMNRQSGDVSEAIEEPMMVIAGEGSGADCDAGNSQKDKTTTKKDIDEEGNLQRRSKMGFKLGMIIDSRTDKIETRSPPDRTSRWDVAPPAKAATGAGKKSFFFGPRAVGFGMKSAGLSFGGVFSSGDKIQEGLSPGESTVEGVDGSCAEEILRSSKEVNFLGEETSSKDLEESQSTDKSCGMFTARSKEIASFSRADIAHGKETSHRKEVPLSKEIPEVSQSEEKEIPTFNSAENLCDKDTVILHGEEMPDESKEKGYLRSEQEEGVPHGEEKETPTDKQEKIECQEIIGCSSEDVARDQLEDSKEQFEEAKEQLEETREQSEESKEQTEDGREQLEVAKERIASDSSAESKHPSAREPLEEAKEQFDKAKEQVASEKIIDSTKSKEVDVHSATCLTSQEIISKEKQFAPEEEPREQLAESKELLEETREQIASDSGAESKKPTEEITDLTKSKDVDVESVTWSISQDKTTERKQITAEKEAREQSEEAKELLGEAKEHLEETRERSEQSKEQLEEAKEQIASNLGAKTKEPSQKVSDLTTSKDVEVHSATCSASQEKTAKENQITPEEKSREQPKDSKEQVENTREHLEETREQSEESKEQIASDSGAQSKKPSKKVTDLTRLIEVDVKTATCSTSQAKSAVLKERQITSEAEAREQLQEAKERLEETKEQLEDTKKQLEEPREQIASDLGAETKKSNEEIMNLTKSKEVDVHSATCSTSQAKTAEEKQLASEEEKREQYEEAKGHLEGAKEQLEEAREQLEDAREPIASDSGAENKKPSEEVTDLTKSKDVDVKSMTCLTSQGKIAEEKQVAPEEEPREQLEEAKEQLEESKELLEEAKELLEEAKQRIASDSGAQSQQASEKIIDLTKSKETDVHSATRLTSQETVSKEKQQLEEVKQHLEETREQSEESKELLEEAKERIASDSGAEIKEPIEEVTDLIKSKEVDVKSATCSTSQVKTTEERQLTAEEETKEQLEEAKEQLEDAKKHLEETREQSDDSKEQIASDSGAESEKAIRLKDVEAHSTVDSNSGTATVVELDTPPAEDAISDGDDDYDMCYNTAGLDSDGEQNSEDDHKDDQNSGKEQNLEGGRENLQKDRQNPEKDRQNLQMDKENSKKDRQNLDKDHQNLDKDHQNMDKDHQNSEKDQENSKIDRQNLDKDHQNLDKVHQNSEKDHQNLDKDHQNMDKDHQNLDKVQQNSEKDQENPKKDRQNLEKDPQNTENDRKSDDDSSEDDQRAIEDDPLYLSSDNSLDGAVKRYKIEKPPPSAAVVVESAVRRGGKARRAAWRGRARGRGRGVVPGKDLASPGRDVTSSGRRAPFTKQTNNAETTEENGETERETKEPEDQETNQQEPKKLQPVESIAVRRSSRRKPAVQLDTTTNDQNSLQDVKSTPKTNEDKQINSAPTKSEAIDAKPKEKGATKNGPFLSCVNINRLKEPEIAEVDKSGSTELFEDDGSTSSKDSVVIIDDDDDDDDGSDPLADPLVIEECPEDVEECPRDVQEVRKNVQGLPKNVQGRPKDVQGRLKDGEKQHPKNDQGRLKDDTECPKDDEETKDVHLKDIKDSRKYLQRRSKHVQETKHVEERPKHVDECPKDADECPKDVKEVRKDDQECQNDVKDHQEDIQEIKDFQEHSKHVEGRPKDLPDTKLLEECPKLGQDCTKLVEDPPKRQVMTLSNFRLDHEDPPEFVPSVQVRGALKRRNRSSDSEGTLSSKKPLSKKPKLKGKRRSKLRRNRETVCISSEDEDAREKMTKTGSREKDDEEAKSKTPNEANSPPQPTIVPPEPKNAPRSRAKRKKTLLGLEIPDTVDLTAETDPTTVTNVRQSRRIAQIKIREEAERRKLDEDHFVPEKKRKNSKKDDKEFKVSLTVTSGTSKKCKRGGVIEVFSDDGDGDDDAVDDVADDTKEGKRKKRKKRSKDPRKIFDESNPWRSSSDSSDDDGDEQEIEEDEEMMAAYSSDAGSPLFRSDHEFSPESDIEEPGEAVPPKRARTAKKEDQVIDANADADDDDDDDHACQRCGKNDHPEWILLCDACDNGWHCSCLRPALLVIPEGDWYCPPCQHATLVKNLQEKLVELDRKLAKREIETRRRERLAYVGISLANVLPDRKKKDDGGGRLVASGASAALDSSENASDSSGSDEEGGSESTDDDEDSDDEPIYQLRQRRQAKTYRFNDYDDLIDSAIRDEMDAVKGSGELQYGGKGKDISTIVNADKEVAADALPPVVPRPGGLRSDDERSEPNGAPKERSEPRGEPSEPEVEEKPSNKKPTQKKFSGRKKTRKLNSLDVSSGDDADSDEDFKGSVSDDDEDEDFEEEDAGSDSSETYGGKRRGPIRRSTRARTSRYDREFINDDDSDYNEETTTATRRRNRNRNSSWDETESEASSDRSWGGKRKRGGGGKRGAPVVSRLCTNKKKKRSLKAKKREANDDDSDGGAAATATQTKKKRRIKYGGLNDDDDEMDGTGGGGRRTRGKKINFAAVLASDSDDEELGRARKGAAAPRRIESDDDYVADENPELEAELEEDGEDEDAAEEEGEEREPRETAEDERGTATTKTTAGAAEPRGRDVTAPRSETAPGRPQAAEKSPPPDRPTEETDGRSDHLNPIEAMNKDLEEMDEEQMEKMMEEEEYANRQLELMALQLNKEKKRRMELEAVKQALQRREDSAEGGPHDLQTGADDGETRADESATDSSPKKRRRGRGKGKKTLEKEAAAASVASSTDAPPPQLAVAAPPLPFSQTQPAPSAITRMLRGPPPDNAGTAAYGRGLPTTVPYYPTTEEAGVPLETSVVAPPLETTPTYLHATQPSGNPVPPPPQYRSQPPPPHLYPRGAPNTGGPPPIRMTIPPPYQQPPPSHLPPQHQAPPPPHLPPPGAAPPPVQQPAYYGGFLQYGGGDFSEANSPPPSLPPDATAKGYEEETGGGEFGGLVSYFSSQREDDLDA